MKYMLTLIVVSLGTVIGAENSPNPIVDVGNTKYRGKYNTTLDVNLFWNIPFAAPPVGPLRWKVPQPYSPPTNQSSLIVDATRPGHTCVQGIPAWSMTDPGIPTGSEDCLVLNIIQPANITKCSELPVVVSIHGGGYTTGDGITIQPYALVHHSKNSFVSVSIQYRLGAYGFMGSKKFVQGGGAENIGLLDQRLALEWIQQHISEFGGDPGKVTIWGGSAGGGSVTSQMVMYGGVEDPPFRAAIANFPWWQQHLREEQLSEQYELLLSVADCTTFECLANLPEDRLKSVTQSTYTQAYINGAYGYGNFYYGPYIDGNVIQGLPSDEFRSGSFTKVPMLVDREGYEGVLFTNQSLVTDDEETRDLKIQFPFAYPKFVEDVYELYPSKDFNSTFWRRQTWFGDFIINCPTYYIANSFANHGVSIYKLIFNAGTQTHAAIGPFLGEITYGTSPGENETLASVMKDWYASFALHADPNIESWSKVVKPHWPVYKDGSVTMSVNYSEVGTVRDEFYDESSRCRFFWERGEIVQN